MAKANRKNTARPRATKAQGSITPSKPDPIFAAIAAHDKACAAIMAYCNRGKDVPLTLTHRKQLRALGRTVPQTPEGVRALGAHVAKWWHNFFNDVADPDIRAMFKSLANSMPGPRTSAGPDPIFAAIEAHKKAVLAVQAACGSNDIPARLVHAEARASERMLRTTPTTTEGVRALCTHIARSWDLFEGRNAAHFKPVFTSLSKAVGVEPSGKDHRAFKAAHARWLKAQARWDAMNASPTGLSDKKLARLVDRLSSARGRATEGLAARTALDPQQLSLKTEALWKMLLCDYKGEAEAIAYGDFDAEAFGLLKSIRRDAERLARGRSS